MNQPEDAAAVLEQFVHNIANLPSEINHIYQEMEVLDKTIQSLRTTNQELDSSIQKSVKANGVSAKAPKEDATSKAILNNFEKCSLLQDESLLLSERAEMLLERHLRKLDKKLRDLQNDGSIPIDHTLPTLLHESPGNLVPLPGQVDHSAQDITFGRSNGSKPGRGPGRPTPLTLQAQTAINNALASATVSHREGSVSDPKRRRGIGGGIGGVSQSGATGRQSSLGPGSAAGTPKTSTPTSRAGSAAPATRPTKKGVGLKKTGPPGPGDRTWLSGVVGPAHRRKGIKGPGGGTTGPAAGKVTLRRGPNMHKASPSTPLSNGNGGGGGDDDSFMSDLEGSEDDDNDDEGDDDDEEEDDDEDDDDDNNSESHVVGLRSKAGAVGRAARGGGGAGGGGIDSSDRMDLDEDEGDDTKYCLCQNVSYGDMVMCDNANCRYQWFHWACIGMDKEPEGDWLCPVCVKLSPGKVQKAQ